MYRAFVTLLFFAILLSGCAGIPEPIRRAPAGDLTLDEVRLEPEDYLGRAVRWGGEIVSVDNSERESWVVVVARRLGFSGRPKDGDRSSGRFLARFEGFVEPATFKAGREITVSGRLEAPQTRLVGAYPYLYPVVGVEVSQLWQPLPKYPPSYRRYPFYDPWYDPWFHPYWW